ncbi:MAG: hypothetical protein A2Z78_02015 [Candidatus Nealsonbacteria bacterium RBG_13_36_15]|uniref:Dockerin domain-containing protein n=1 Tax=Candidatus Nealsonbacteria bacterium RBG_13_36_15 TaxID=1801660 RepID=A0A1G2DVG0_9BACT|nr:MAG: hypothetical protein A2Z78_02015 [Candidatus Nealsonbacteria bacterium RBG_13_36_15]
MKKAFSPILVLGIFIFSFCFLLLIFNNTLAAQLSNRRVTISDSRGSTANVTYNYQWTGSLNLLRCIQIVSCTTAAGACNTPVGLNTTGSSKGNFVGLTAANWNLDNTTNGTLTLINGAGEAPAANVSTIFTGITNPTNEATYFGRITTYSDINCLNQVDSGNVAFVIIGGGINVSVTIPAGGGPGGPPGGGGGGGGGEPVGHAKVIFEGRAYPKAFITLLKNGKVANTFLAETSGLFEAELTGVAGGVYSFGFFAEDTEGRRSVTISFTVGVIDGTTTTISGIFISPTISLSPTQVEIGRDVNIAGQVFPQSQIKIFVSSQEVVKDTKADVKGKWGYKLNTGFLEEGEHNSRAKAIFGEGEQSDFSQIIPFLVVKKGALVCKGADLNFDGKINIVDFSILLYFWDQTDPSNRCADINFDGIVNIVDFSVMMYWWTR